MTKASTSEQALSEAEGENVKGNKVALDIPTIHPPVQKSDLGVIYDMLTTINSKLDARGATSTVGSTPAQATSGFNLATVGTEDDLLANRSLLAGCRSIEQVCKIYPFMRLPNLIQFLIGIITRSYNECIGESMCKVVSQHNAVGRPLHEATLKQEVFISHNGPPPWAANEILQQSLNSHFGGTNWHFVTTRGIQRSSSTIMRLQKNYRKLPFH